MTVETPDSPFFLEGTDPDACLLVHGSTGTAGDLRGLGDHLHACGYTVQGISLPGHARRPAQLAGISWRDCFATVHEAWQSLRARHATVHVIGFSFGGALSLHLAATEPVDDLVVLAPGLHANISKREIIGALLGLIPGTWMHTRFRWNLDLLAFFKRVAGELGRVDCPILIMHARDDPLVQVKSSHEVHDGVASTDRRLVIYEEGGHLLPWGPLHRQVWEEVERHVREHRGAGAG